MEKGIFLPGLESSQLRQNPSIIISSVKNISCLFSFLLWVQPLLDSFGITLCHGVNDGQDEVTHHYNDQLLKHPGQPVFSLRCAHFAFVVKLLPLGFQVFLEWLLQRWTNARDSTNESHHLLHYVFAECYYNKDFLNMHFNYCFSNQGCTKESPKRYKKVSTCYSSQIEVDLELKRKPKFQKIRPSALGFERPV